MVESVTTSTGNGESDMSWKSDASVERQSQPHSHLQNFIASCRTYAAVDIGVQPVPGV